MRIAIEAQRIFRKEKHGMDFVVLEILRRLPKLAPQDEFFVFVAPGNDECLQESSNLHIIQLSCPGGYPMWEQVALPSAVRKLKPDVLHCTSNTAPIFCSCPLMITLHDIIFLEKQAQKNKSLYQGLGRLYRKLVVPAVVPHCKKIITVSNYEKARIAKAFPLEDGVLSAVYNGFGSQFHPMEKADAQKTASKYISGRYLFFLGNTDPKKNTDNVMRAYAMYLDQSAEKLPLLVADLSAEKAAAIAQQAGVPQVMEHIKLPGYIANTDLPAIYNAADAFLYPSLRESFGIPLLEAMACGTPVISANTSCIPEIAGNAGILVNPLEPGAIADALLHLEKDAAYREDVISKGMERAKEFNWDSTAAKVLEIYHNF